MNALRLVVGLIVGACAGVCVPQKSFAHPHVWVTVQGELVYAEGRFVGVKYRWVFDDMFSTYATQGLDTDKDGKLSREELAGLAEVNITSMKDFDYFTRAAMNGKPITFDTPKDYALEHDKDRLTLSFTLPLKTPTAAQKLEVDIYDPTYFVSFELAEKEPLVLAGAPPKCNLTILRPGESGKGGQRLSESFFNSLTNSSEYGAAYANKVLVKCP